MSHARHDRVVRLPRGPGGQATVELALSLPVVVVLALLLVHVGLVVRAQVLVVHAARAGARAASLDPRPGAAARAARAAAPFGRDHLDIEERRSKRADPVVTVMVRDRVITGVPIVGRILGAVTVSATATLPVEPTSASP